MIIFINTHHIIQYHNRTKLLYQFVGNKINIIWMLAKYYVSKNKSNFLSFYFTAIIKKGITNFKKQEIQL